MNSLVFADIVRSITAARELSVILQRVADGARELCRADLSAIALREDDSGEMVFRYRAGDRLTSGGGRLVVVAGRGAGGRVLESGQAFRSEDIPNDPRVASDPAYLAAVAAEQIVSVVCVPIRGPERIEGLLYVDNRGARPVHTGRRSDPRAACRPCRDRDSQRRPARPGAAGAHGRRSREPAQGRVFGHGVPRAAHTAQRDPRVDDHAAQSAVSPRAPGRRARGDRAEWPNARSPHRGSPRRLAHRDRQAAARIAARRSRGRRRRRDRCRPPGGRRQAVDGNVELAVSDTGAGIEPADLPRIFDRFHQADRSPSRRQGGLGIGLALARHIVEGHGGWIVAHSDGAGRGATFSVTLPLLEASASERWPEIPVGPAGRSGLFDGTRVLVAEDQPDTLALFVTVLTAAGAEVRPARSAAEALDVFRVWRPEVVISDIEMPGEDGFALLEKLRGLMDPGTEPAAIAVTAYGRPEDRRRILAAGFLSHLVKPVDPAELITTVAAVARRPPRAST